ncbi:MAG: sigma-70 family RNA polymerase sigma factor [Myxococcota bacterium]
MARPQPRHLRLARESTTERLSFEELFRRWAPYVGGIATRILGPRADVDDLVQNVFVDAYRGYGKLRDPDAVRSWLTTITVRRARRYLARQRFRRLVGLEAIPEIPDTAILPERRAQLSAAYRVLNRVKPEERIAWVLRHVEGETLLDVARLCDCSRATAHRRIRAVADAFAKEFGHES